MSGRGKILLAFALLCLSGCGKGGFASARGQLLYPDGSPAAELEGFQVVFEGTGTDGRNYSSTGTIDAQGRFEMFTVQPGDGVPVGVCKVLIEPKMLDSEREAPYPVDRKYRTFDTSNLKAEVKSQGNDYKWTVERAKAGPGKKGK